MKKACDKVICSSADELKEYLAKTNYVQSNYKSKGPLHINSNDELPLNVESLGKCSWPLFHNIAYNYPNNPTGKKQNEAHKFLKAFADFYPCEECRADFQTQIKNLGFNVNNKLNLAESLCQQHNMVKQKIHQAQYFSCARVDLLLNPYLNMNSKIYKNFQ